MTEAEPKELTDPLVVGLGSFDVFYQREYPRAVRLAAVLSGSRLAAEDLAQEAFIKAHERWDQIGRYERPEAWIRRVITNQSVSLFRKRKAETRALLKHAASRLEWLPELRPETEELWDAVRKLPTRQAQVVALTYLEEMTLKEVAEVLRIGLPTAGTHLQRGRATLAKKLGLRVEEPK